MTDYKHEYLAYGSLLLPESLPCMEGEMLDVYGQ